MGLPGVGRARPVELVRLDRRADRTRLPPAATTKGRDVQAPRTRLFTGTALLLLSAGCSGTSVTAAPITSPTTTTTTAATTTPAGPTCGVDLGARAITAAVTRLRPASTDPALSDVTWAPTPDGGNYDPCATLSAASVTVEGATGGSPEQVMMFHDGVYQGTGTLQAYGLTTIDVAASTADTVVVRYRYVKPGESTAAASGLATVRYRWVEGAVVMLDQLPPEVTS